MPVIQAYWLWLWRPSLNHCYIGQLSECVSCVVGSPVRNGMRERLWFFQLYVVRFSPPASCVCILTKKHLLNNKDLYIRHTQAGAASVQTKALRAITTGLRHVHVILTRHWNNHGMLLAKGFEKCWCFLWCRLRIKLPMSRKYQPSKPPKPPFH